MLRTRLFLVSALAVFAVGTANATMATAAEFVVEEENVTNTVAVAGTSGVSTLKGKLGGEEIVVTCKKDALKGELEKAGKAKGETTLEECSVGNKKGEELSACEVPNMKSKPTEQLTETAGVVEDEFKPAAGATVLVEVEIKSKSGKTCLEKGKFPVEGTQKCKLPSGETAKVEHEFECTPSGSHLTFDHETATFEGTDKVQLASGQKWNVEGINARAWYIEATKLAAEEKLKRTVVIRKFAIFSNKLKALIECDSATLSNTSAIRPETEMPIPALELDECEGDFAEVGCELESAKISTNSLEGFLENNRFIKFEPTGLTRRILTFKVVKDMEEKCNEVGEWTVKGLLLAKLRQPEAEIKARKLAFERSANSSLEMISPKSEDKTEVFLEAEIEGLEVASGKPWSAKKP